MDTAREKEALRGYSEVWKKWFISLQLKEKDDYCEVEAEETGGRERGEGVEWK